MVCQKCGIDLPETFAFCPMCGKSVAKQEKKRRRRANGEGSVIRRGKSYSIRITTGWALKDGRAVQQFAETGGFNSQKAALEHLPTLREEAMRPNSS